MANPITDEPFIIDEACVRFQAVTQAAAGHAELVDATADVVLGIVQETVLAADAGLRAVSVRTHGTSVAIAGSAITAGAELKVTAAAKFIPVTTAGDIIAGRARTAAGADGDWFEIDLYPSVKHA